ncbi:hypothetical protein COA01_23070 [Bacillus cereus]|uniref:hypothetical protein n=1 Tax=Bacillus cereus TaxID=1396 RepID=UPI000BFC09E5|nr:hypothetical protein [Bacillus cereus]PGP18627.1 hypothetical protein COA01_23070 [Bacillus cereus]
MNSHDFSLIEQLFTKYKFDYLFEEIRLKILVLKDAFKDENEFSYIIEESLLIAYQEERILNIESFFTLFERVQQDLRIDAEIEFREER